MIPLQIGIIEYNLNILEEYKAYLLKSLNLECVLGVDSIEKFIKYYRPHVHLDVILLDIGQATNLELKNIEKIKKIVPKAKIVIFSNIISTETVIKSLRLGAVGYILKNQPKEALDQQLLSINQTGVAISPAVIKILVGYFSPNTQIFTPSGNNQLSPKENQIINLLLEGLTYAEISYTLNITINGVRYHIKNIYKKLKVNSRAEIHNIYLNRED